jgi:lipopolysaccharide transport system permease protein
VTEAEPATNPPSASPPAEQSAPAHTATDNLPVTIIEPSSGIGLGVLAEVWRFRELLLFLVWRDVKIRYKQTVIGVLWAVLQPVAVMGVMTFALGRIAGEPGSAIPYWLFVLAGLVPWTFLASAVSGAGMSIVANQQLVTKVYFPRVLLPLSAAGLAGVDFLVGCGVLAAAACFAAPALGWHLLLLPLAVAVLILVAAGLGLLFAAVTVKYRDFRVVLPLLMQMWLFLTPAIYLQAGSNLGTIGEVIQILNPAHGVIAAFRTATLGTPFDWETFATSAALGTLLFVTGLWYFHKVERSFADVI